jgi:hypothetical protein
LCRNPASTPSPIIQRIPTCAAWSDHSDEELWATVAFLEKLPGISGQDYASLPDGQRRRMAVIIILAPGDRDRAHPDPGK